MNRYGVTCEGFESAEMIGLALLLVPVIALLQIAGL